jgi:hypothetical protein
MFFLILLLRWHRVAIELVLYLFPALSSSFLFSSPSFDCATPAPQSLHQAPSSSKEDWFHLRIWKGNSAFRFMMNMTDSNNEKRAALLPLKILAI